MRAIIQRVKRAAVLVEGETVGEIKGGLVVFLSIEAADEVSDEAWLLRKITQLKLFTGEDGKLSKSLLGVCGELLLISQFTLHASTKKGTRPSFHRSAPPEMAKEKYESFCKAAEALLPCKVQTGVFSAHMEVSLINDGPVTLILDSKAPE